MGTPNKIKMLRYCLKDYIEINFASSSSMIFNLARKILYKGCKKVDSVRGLVAGENLMLFEERDRLAPKRLYFINIDRKSCREMDVSDI
jgi:hypothetical protein